LDTAGVEGRMRGRSRYGTKKGGSVAPGAAGAAAGGEGESA